MSGLSGLNPSEGALVIGLVQSARPSVRDAGELSTQAAAIARVVAAARSTMPTLDLIVFPEYSLGGADQRIADDILCDLDGPEIAVLRQACADSAVWGCFSFLERRAQGAPYNAGIVVDDAGNVALHYRKMHPMVPYEPWHPGDLGVPVCPGPAGSVLALLICHDGMFPEMAREAAYRGANVILRTAGYPEQLRRAWRITNQANALSNLAYTASVALAGPDDAGLWSLGEAMICDPEGRVVEQGDRTPGRIVTGEIVPARADAMRRRWGPENNIYQLGHRGYVAVPGGEPSGDYRYIRDLANGRYRLPWEDEVQITDGTGFGFPAPPRGDVRD